MKIDKLRAMLRQWKEDKSIILAYDICEFLVENMSLEEK